MKAAVLECLSPLLLTDLEQVTDMAIMIINTKGKIICYSKGCERIEGFKREDVIGLSPDELYNPKQFPNVNRAKRSMVLDTLNTGQLYHEHLDYYTTINGTEANILCSTYPLHDKSGSLQGVLCIYQEVSEYLEMISISNKNQSDKPHNLPALNGTQYTFDAIIGTHPKMQKALYRGKVAAKADAPVLIFGETGTGKELFAQSIHNESACRNGNFVAINCSAIPDTLLESTLFGTVRGSYTGATDRKGLFEEAQNGTLFLDELNAMDIGLQSKLLRVLETGKFRRVGAQEEKNCQCRIISALNEDPFAAIENNIIRADLYYRLAVFSIELPPLRARKEDILATSKSFLSNLAPVLGKKTSQLSKEVTSIFEHHSWPGNTRELKHVITQAIYFARKDDVFIKPYHLPDYLLKITASEKKIISPAMKDAHLSTLLQDYESQIIAEKLLENKNNVSETARQLGISRTNLHNKIKKYGLAGNED